ncbi:hypothetical protein DL96DRAFT_1643403 [Flagelloscypha sp. PMI_526]|nr:hypothetical protein DL96DRAFT_1643403 [Flagelloscypha sp. PMI_526]
MSFPMKANLSSSNIPILTPELPQELIEAVFLVAAHTTVRWQLALVSKHIQALTDPIVFQHLAVRGGRDEDASNARMRRFLDVFSWQKFTLRFTSALLCVQSIQLGVSFKGSSDQWSSIFTLFPRLRAIGGIQISSHNLFFQYAFDGFAPSLLYPDIEMACKSELLRNITHMDLTCLDEFDWYPVIEDPHFKNLPNLQYLFFDLADKTSADDVIGALQSLNDNLPLPLCLCLVNIGPFTVSDSTSIGPYLNEELDLRLLLCSKDGERDKWILEADVFKGFKEWCGDMEPELTFWARGDEMVRQRSLVSQHEYWLNIDQDMYTARREVLVHHLQLMEI